MATGGVMGRWKATTAAGVPGRDRRAKDSEDGVGDRWYPCTDDAEGVPGRLHGGEEGRESGLLYGGEDGRDSASASDMSMNERWRPGGDSRYSLFKLGERLW